MKGAKRCGITNKDAEIAKKVLKHKDTKDSKKCRTKKEGESKLRRTVTKA
jgi:hypothetical protein